MATAETLLAASAAAAAAASANGVGGDGGEEGEVCVERASGEWQHTKQSSSAYSASSNSKLQTDAWSKTQTAPVPQPPPPHNRAGADGTDKANRTSGGTNTVESKTKKGTAGSRSTGGGTTTGGGFSDNQEEDDEGAEEDHHQQRKRVDKPMGGGWTVVSKNYAREVPVCFSPLIFVFI